MKTRLLILLMMYCALSSPAQSVQPGLDPTFGKLGRVTDIVDSGVRYRDATGIAIQPDGKIITTGQFILRFHPDGRPDSSFGGTGLIKPSSLTYPEASYAKGVLLQPDGKIVVTGTVHNNFWNNDTAIVIRLTNNGELDSSFGNNGVRKLVGFNRWGKTISLAGNADCSLLQSDGKILVAGNYSENDPFAIIARLTKNGSIDSSFGGQGFAKMKIGRYNGGIIGHGFNLMSDGRIIIAGQGADSSDVPAQFLIRLMPDGSPDTSLGHTGQRFPFNASYTREIIIQPDGKTLMCVQGFNGMQAVIRFGLDGNIDESYGEQGFAYVPDTFVVATGLLMKNGQLLLAGRLGNDFAVTRILAEGKGIDYSFGINGSIRTDQSNFSYELITALALQADGKIIAGGQGYLDNWHPMTASVVRYKADAYVAVPETIPASMKVFLAPNPARDKVSVTGITRTEFRRLDVYTMDGRLVTSQSVLPEFSISTLPDGLYLVKIQTKNGGTRASILSVKH